MKIRVGLVGFGPTWEKRHRPALRALTDRFEVRAVCDQVAHRAELVAAEFDACLETSYQALVFREDVDAVLVLSRQWFGILPVLAAHSAGKAVYFCAGLNRSLREASQIRDRVRRSGVVLMTEFVRRHSPATLRLKELIATRLGQPQLLFCHHRLSLPVGPHCSGHGGQSTARELAELVDWCRFVVGREPRWVTGTMYAAADAGSEKEYQMMSLGFSEPATNGGPLAQISCGRYIPENWSEAITYRPLAALQVNCERGIAFVDLPSTLIWFDEAGRHHEALESERPVGEQLLMQFYRIVTGHASGPSNLEDAYRALWIVDEARRSYREGGRIEF
jgi:predicted dehydrogenase